MIGPKAQGNFTESIIRSNLESVRTFIKINLLGSRKSYVVIIDPNSHAKLIKSVLRLNNWNWFENSQNQKSN